MALTRSLLIDDDELKLRQLVSEMNRKNEDPGFMRDYLRNTPGYKDEAINAEFLKQGIQTDMQESITVGQAEDTEIINIGGVDFNKSDLTFAQALSLEKRENEKAGGGMALADSKASATERQAIADIDATTDMVTEAETLLEGISTGPLAGRVQGVQQLLPGGGDEDFNALEAKLSNIKSSFMRAISGANVSEQEVRRLSKFLPEATDQEVIIKNKLEALKNEMAGRKKATLETLGITPETEASEAKDSGKAEYQLAPAPAEDAKTARIRGWLEANPDDPRATQVKGILDKMVLGKGVAAPEKMAEVETPEVDAVLPGEEPEDRKRKRGAAEMVGGFLGGEQIGEAIGNIIGAKVAEKAEGQRLKDSIVELQTRFQDGKITQEFRDKHIEALEQNARDAFGYDGPSGKQIVGDIGRIGLNFVGGAALKGGGALLKMTGIGVLAGGAEAMAEDKDVSQGAMIGGVLGGTLGVAGKVVGAGLRKLDQAVDISGKADKLAVQILQPSKKEMAKAIERGGVPGAVNALKTNVKKSKDFNELRTHMQATTSAIFDRRNNLIRKNNFAIGGEYLKPLEREIARLEKSKLATPAQIAKMKQVLAQEQGWLKEQGGIMTRMDAQARKTAVGDLVAPLLKKKEAGNLALDEANNKVALDAIRKGLKEAVEGGSKEVRDINSQYAGLKRATELLSGREALAMKDIDLTLWQKIVSPLVDIMSAASGAGSAQFVAKLATKQQDKLVKLTGKLEKLSQSKGGLFTEMYKTLRGLKGQGAIGDALDTLDAKVSNIKPGAGLSIEDVTKGLSKTEVNDVTRVLKDIGYDGFGGMDKDQFIGHFSEANRELYEKIIKRDKTIFDRVYRNAASLVGDNIKRDFSTPAVGKTALATEAKKYKTADEFVKGQGEIFHRTDREFKDFDSSINPDEFGTWFSTTKELSEESKDTLPILMKRFVDKKIKLITENKLSKLENTDEYLDYTGTMGDFLLKKGYEGVDYLDGSIQLVRPNKITQTRSQLTDIWNKANNKKQRKAIRDLK